MLFFSFLFPLFCPPYGFRFWALSPSFLAHFWARSFAVLFYFVFRPALLPSFWVSFLGFLFHFFFCSFFARSFSVLFLPRFFCPHFCIPFFWLFNPFFFLLRFGLSFGYPKRPSRGLAQKRQLKLIYELTKLCPKLENILKGKERTQKLSKYLKNSGRVNEKEHLRVTCFMNYINNLKEYELS